MQEQPAPTQKLDDANIVPTDEIVVPQATQAPQRPVQGQHSWKSELANELKDIIKGFDELGSKMPDLKKLLTDLVTQADQLVKDDVAKLLIDSKLQFFAGKLLGGGYDEQADFENNTTPILQNTEAQDVQLGSAPSATAPSSGQPVQIPVTDGTPQPATEQTPAVPAAPATVEDTPVSAPATPAADSTPKAA